MWTGSRPASPTYRRLSKPVDPKRKSAYGSFQDTPEIRDAWKATVAFAIALQAKVVVLQCPASFEPTQENKDNLNHFLKMVGRVPFRLALEVRGRWGIADVRSFVESFDLIHAIDPFYQQESPGDVFYYRLHGKGGYSYKYTDGELSHLAGQVEEASRARAGYVLFNNVFMGEDALRFLRIMPALPQACH